jgi:hypothetical protein
MQSAKKKTSDEKEATPKHKGLRKKTSDKKKRQSQNARG